MNFKKLNLFAFDGEEMADGVATTETTETAETNETQVANEDKGKAFEELIKGEYKEEYDKRIKDTLNRRFKANRDSEAELSRYSNLTSLLSKKYGTTDPEELYEKIGGDDDFYEQRAYDAGMSVEQYKRLEQLSLENERYKAEAERINEMEQINAIYSGWMAEAEEAKAIYPNLDLDVESENEKFTSLLENGWSVKDAYQAVHHDEIMAEMMSESAKRAKQDAVNNMMSRNNRPVENGVHSQQGANTKLEVSKMTREQIHELINRARGGEKITLG